MIKDFDELIKDGIHLVDFYATWCGPCKVVSELLNDFEDKIDIIRVDTDKNSKLVFKYRIMSVPTLCFFKNGKVFKELVGITSKEEIEKIIKEINE